MMMLAANAPDIDAVFWFNRQHYLDYHRAYTHSFACAPLMALLPMLLVRARFSWKAYGAAVAGILSHLLLDWTNPYGINLLLPFSHRRLMLDITNIADVWIWAILFLGLLAPLAAKKKTPVDGKIVETPNALPGRAPRMTWAFIALAVLVTYEGGRFALHAKAIEMLESQTYRGQAPSQTIAVPADFLHPALWKGIARNQGFVTIVPLDVQDGFDAAGERMWDDPPPGPAVAAARKLPEFQTMIRFSQAPFWNVTPLSGGGYSVELLDLRYGTPDQPGFAVASSVVP